MGSTLFAALRLITGEVGWMGEGNMDDHEFDPAKDSPHRLTQSLITSTMAFDSETPRLRQ
jgi:hypothetical protein